MWRYKLAWYVWVAGSVLIALSWLDVVSRSVGWVGFFVASLGVVFSFILNVQPNATVTPRSYEGWPEQPSGIWVTSETPLAEGSLVLAFSQGRWWKAEVVALEADDMVRVRYPGWDTWWQEHHRRTDLQCIAGQTSRPDERIHRIRRNESWN